MGNFGRYAAAAAALLTAFGSRAAAAPTLVQVAESVGVDHVTRSRSAIVGAGVAIFDYDRDGRPDLLFADDQDGCWLYRNEEGPGLGVRFRDVSVETEVASLCRGLAVTIVDYDQDGWDDIVVADKPGLTLLKNVGGRFVDRTVVAGLGGELGAATVTAADVDRDGFPELYVGSYVTLGQFPEHRCGANRFYRNRGDGTFENVTATLDVGDAGCALAVAFLDLDGDGDLDLFVANDFGTIVAPNQVYRNDGEAFTPVGTAWGADQGMYAMGIAFGDVDQDGRVDLFVTNIGRALLLRGRPGGFEDATESYGVGFATVDDGERTLWRATWGTVFADLDLDGWEDLFVASGYLLAEPPIEAARLQVDGLFLGGPAALGAGEVDDDPRSSRGVAMGDLNGDGAPDLVVSHVVHRSATLPEHRPSIYLSVPPSGVRFARIRLNGTVSERRAHGARVTLSAGGRTQWRIVDPGGASHGSHHQPLLLFGVGAAGLVEGVEVDWPSGARTRHGPYASGTEIVISEPQWLQVPRVASAGGEIELSVRPLGADGAPLGPGHQVTFEVERGTLTGTLVDEGGTYRQRLLVGDEPGRIVVRVRVDGQRLPVARAVRVVGADDTLVGVSDPPLRAGEEATVNVLPRNGEGQPLGPGKTVTAQSASGATIGTVTDLGDGRYEVRVTPPAEPAELTLSVEVDGVPQARTLRVPITTPFDPDRSFVEAIRAVAVPGDRVIVRAHVFDGAGRRSPASSALVMTTSGGRWSGDASVAQGLVSRLLDLPFSEGVIRVSSRVGEVPFPRETEIHVLRSDAPIPSSLIDPARSQVYSFHGAMPADGLSVVRVLAAVRDVNGGYLPGRPHFVFRATDGRWRGPATAFLGSMASRCLIAPTTPELVEVTATVSGVPLRRAARIRFHPALAGDPVQDGCGGDSNFEPLPEGPDGGADSDAGSVDSDGGAVVADGGAGADAGVEQDGGAALPDGGVGDRALYGCSAGGASGPATGGGPILVALLGLALALRRRRARRFGASPH